MYEGALIYKAIRQIVELGHLDLTNSMFVHVVNKS